MNKDQTFVNKKSGTCVAIIAFCNMTVTFRTLVNNKPSGLTSKVMKDWFLQNYERIDDVKNDNQS